MNKRTILVVDDNKVNRQILHKILSNDYNIIEAENGAVALTALHENGEIISAVLLDIIMPIMDGYEVLRQMSDDSLLSKIPVIVASGQNGEDAEVKALSLGANDFIVKPYKPVIIKHRIANTIYLRETAAFINSVQKDSLTGINSKEYFYQCASEIMQGNPQKKYDLICCDIERFKLVNDLYGIATGDELLKYTAATILKFTENYGICGRIGADVFACLIEHRNDYENKHFLEATKQINTFDVNLDIVLRYGIYCIDDITTPINIICDRACLAKDSIKEKYDAYFAYYDDTVRQKLLNEQFITSSMKNALQQHQFHVYFQPKFDLQTEQIVGAEALVRWIHPERGMLMPGEFIPLFEKNGFVTDLDIYLWEQCCIKLRAWMDAGHCATPLSVNVSRADIYNPNLPEILLSMIKRHRISPHYLHLEITETAYTENPEQLIEVVSKLKKFGFIIEMDDFGTGYSSLNMLSELPIDILKLDIKFIQSEQKKNNNKSILSFIISLAKWLNLSVIAEGVETIAQVKLLQALNCEYAQGYYYAKPLPQDQFEELLLKSDIQALHPTYQQLDSEKIVVHLETMLLLDSSSRDYSAFQEFFSTQYLLVQTYGVAETLENLQKSKGDVAVLFINCSDGIRIEEIEAMEKECSICAIPFLVIDTSWNDLLEKALSLGASDYILRPYRLKALEKRIENAICRLKMTQFQKEKEINTAILEMKKRAEEDSLTGLLNRSEFEIKIESFFHNNKNPEGIFVILDVDNFKQINDSFGHMVGDKVLCMIADMLTHLFPETNIISRIGGDEFALFIPYRLEAFELKNKMLHLCQMSNFDAQHLHISCSAGVCISPTYGLDYEQLYLNADAALLASKRNGKRQYKLYEKGLEIPLVVQLENKAICLLDDTSDAMFVSDSITSEILYINETACQIVGKSKQNCIGERCYQLFWDRCRHCDRCLSIDGHTAEFYEEDTFLKDHKTTVHIKAKLGDWDGRKVKIHYLQNLVDTTANLLPK